MTLYVHPNYFLKKTSQELQMLSPVTVKEVFQKRCKKISQKHEEKGEREEIEESEEREEKEERTEREKRVIPA